MRFDCRFKDYMDMHIIISMATVMILTLVFCLVSISGVDSTDAVSITVNENTPHVFEGILLRILCTVDSKYQSVTWIKDNSSIITYKRGIELSKNLPALTTLDYFPLSSKSLYILSLSNLSIVEHSGIYECVGKTEEGGASKSDKYSLTISKRMPVCVTDKTSHLEYLTGDKIVLLCYNPIYDPRRIVEWSRSDLEYESLEAVTTGDENSSVLNATINLEAEMNGTNFICNATVTENRTTSLTTDVLSCRIGPVKVYDSPFISITEVVYEGANTNRVFSCRITPRPINIEAIEWSEIHASYVIVTTNVSSDIIFTDSAELSQIGPEITILCTGTAYGLELSATYTFDSSSPSGNSNGSNRNPGLFSIIVVAVVAVLFLFFIGLFILLVCSMKNCRKSKDNPKRSKFVEEANESSLSPPPYSSDMILTTLPDGRYQLRPHHISIVSAGSDSETERSPLTFPDIDDNLYDLPPGYTDQPASPIYTNK